MLQKTVIVLSFVLLHVQPSYADGVKYIRSGSRALNSANAMSQFMKKSDFLTPSLKQACAQVPERYYELGMVVLRILYFASQRPNALLIDSAEERLLNGSATMHDCVAVFIENICYGEGMVVGNSIEMLSSEPTCRPRDWRDFSFEKSFTSALVECYELISTIGSQAAWSEEKIKEEKKLFAANVAAFVKQGMHSLEENPAAVIKLLEEKNCELQAEVKQLNEELTASAIRSQETLQQVQQELMEERHLNESQCNHTRRVQNSLKILEDDYLRVVNAESPLLDQKAFLCGALGFLLSSAVSYMLNQ